MPGGCNYGKYGKLEVREKITKWVGPHILSDQRQGMAKSQITRSLYRSLAVLLRMGSRCAWDFRSCGTHGIPPGPKIFVGNHVASVDPYWVMMAVPEFLHFVVGPPFGIRWLAPILRTFEQINAMPQHRKTVVTDACEYLAKGESVYIAPEGDVQPPFQLGHFYTGMAKIYRESGVPIIPVAMAVSPGQIRRHPRWDMVVEGRTFEARMVWRGKIRVMIGEAMTPPLNDDKGRDEGNRCVTEEVRARIDVMLRGLAKEFELSNNARI